MVEHEKVHINLCTLNIKKDIGVTNQIQILIILFWH